MMTGPEILSHVLAALGASGPAVGLLIGERAKRKTAEAQTTTHVAEAIADATRGIRTTLDTVQGIAKSALEKAREAEGKVKECEDGRASEKADYENRIKMLETCRARDEELLNKFGSALEASEKRGQMMALELASLHELIADLKPSTIHTGVVE